MTDAGLLDTALALKRRIDALRPLEAGLLRQIREYYRIGLTWSSNALEGNSLSESETKVLLEDGLTVGGKPIRDYYEAAGHAKAYDHMLGLATDVPLTGDDIRIMHHLFYGMIDEARAGVYRTERAIITGSRYPLTAPERIADEMESLVAWYAEAERVLHPVMLAAQAHKRLVFIHPFIDGNGRVARLVMNCALIRSGYTIAIIPPVLRAEYIALLEEAHQDDAGFNRFIASRVIETQKELLGILGA
jgi:Fic family protein